MDCNELVTQQRSVIRFLTFEKNTSQDIHNRLQNLFGNDTMSRKSVQELVQKFQGGQVTIGKLEEGDQSSDTKLDLNKVRLEALVKCDRQLTLRELASKLNLSHEKVGKLLEELNYQKVAAKWIPQSLSEEQRIMRLETCQDLLEQYTHGREAFLNCIVTGDETWLSYYETDPTEKHRKWAGHPMSPRPMRFKWQRTNKKVMATIFWDHKGPLLIDFLEPNIALSAHRYCESLRKLKTAIRRKRPELRDQDVCLFHDNTRPHTAYATSQLLGSFQWAVVTYPPFSPDLAPSDFYLFGPLKYYIRGMYFTSEEDVQEATRSWLRHKSANFYHKGIYLLPLKWQKCVDSKGDYFDEEKGHL